jgi:pathogenesis-related protein 1
MMHIRNLPTAMALVFFTGCSAASGGDSSPDESTDAASSQDAGGSLADAGSMTPSAANDGASPPPAEASAGQGVDSSDAGAEEAAAIGASDAGGAEGGNAEGGDPESGRLVGITAAHNAVRAAVITQPPLPPLVWSQTVADYAQQWATSLATSMCADPAHRSAAELEAVDYGENLATFGAGGLLQSGEVSTAEQAVDAWAAEKACWTFGTIQGTEVCNTACYTNLHSDGCGHYTQVVWRDSAQLGCGVATCKNGALTEDIWICNYAPAGNIVGRPPY